MSSLRGLLLDLDGTIADSIDFFYRLACEILEAARCGPPERRAVLDAIANGVVPHERFLPVDLPDREAFLARLYREQWPLWLERYGAEVEPIAGAVETVRGLGDRGLRLGLVTSSSGPLPFLDRWGIRDCFAAVVGRNDVRRIKPDPEALLLALDRMGPLRPRCSTSAIRRSTCGQASRQGSRPSASSPAPEPRNSCASPVRLSCCDHSTSCLIFSIEPFSDRNPEECVTPPSARPSIKS